MGKLYSLRASFKDRNGKSFLSTLYQEILERLAKVRAKYIVIVIISLVNLLHHVMQKQNKWLMVSLRLRFILV